MDRRNDLQFKFNVLGIKTEKSRKVLSNLTSHRREALVFNSNHNGPIHFLMSHAADVEVHSAIIVVDGTSRMTYKDVPLWIKDLKRLHEGIAIVVCEIWPKDQARHTVPSYLTRMDVQYCAMDPRDGLNLPFLLLARKLTGVRNLDFV